MVFRLPYEEYTNEIFGTSVFPAVGEIAIERIILSATRHWAERKHIEGKVELFSEKPSEAQSWEQYSPMELYAIIHIANASDGRLTPRPYSHKDVSLANHVRKAYDFVKEVHSALRRTIFEEFILDYAESEHPDPQKMSVRECLVYAKEYASTVKGPGRVEPSPKGKLDLMLQGKNHGIMCMECIIERVIDRLYSPSEQLVSR